MISRFIDRSLVNADFALVLPLMARLPATWANALTHLRTWLQLRHQGDWRRFLPGGEGLHHNKALALEEINAWRAERAQPPLPLAHYYHQWALEELQTQRFIADRIPRLEVYGHLAPPPAVYVSIHSGVPVVFSLLTHQNRIRAHLIASAVTERPEIPWAVRRFYRKKYHALNRRSCGGNVWFLEHGLKALHRRLLAGDSLITITDLPPPANGEAIPVSLFGKTRFWAGGSARIALQHRRPLQPFVTELTPSGWTIRLGPAISGTELSEFQPAYQFLANAIERRPEGWWALDLLAIHPLNA